MYDHHLITPPLPSPDDLLSLVQGSNDGTQRKHKHLEQIRHGEMRNGASDFQPGPLRLDGE